MAKDQEIKRNTRKRKIIEAAKDLFSRFGYKKVTIEEVCRTAGVSKMTYYRFFENKIELVRFIMTEMSDDGRQTYREIMQRKIPFEEKIRLTIRMKEDMSARYSEQLLRDLYADMDGDLMALIRRLTAEMLDEVLGDYRKAREEGYVRKDLNLDIIPYFLNQITNMLKDPVLLAVTKGNMKKAMMELTNLFFYGIMEPNRES